MKIIMGATSFELDKHATAYFENERLPYSRQRKMQPRGVAVHSARYPQTCDDCGLTFWTKDEFGSGGHPRCRGTMTKAGF